MAKQRNGITYIVRKEIGEWLSKLNKEKFNVIDIINDLSHSESFSDICLNKAVSNELIRLKTIGMIVVDGKVKQPTGRPANSYRKVWCCETLEVLKGDILPSKLTCKGGVVEVYVFLKGMVRIFKGYDVYNKDTALELLKHHMQFLDKASSCDNL